MVSSIERLAADVRSLDADRLHRGSDDLIDGHCKALELTIEQQVVRALP
jgi:hypothetical protein